MFIILQKIPKSMIHVINAVIFYIASVISLCASSKDSRNREYRLEDKAWNQALYLCALCASGVVLSNLQEDLLVDCCAYPKISGILEAWFDSGRLARFGNLAQIQDLSDRLFYRDDKPLERERKTRRF